MKRVTVIDEGQGLLLVSLTRTMKMPITSVETKVHLSKAWEMTQWVEHLTKSPNHPSHAKSREGDFLGDSLSQRSPRTMVGQNLWSMWATLTREWLCTPRMRPWCARYSHPIWSLWQWGGLIPWERDPLIPVWNSLKPLDLALLHAVGFLGP